MTIAKGRRPKPPEKRFWTRIDPCRTDGCMIWTGGLDSHGYGQFWDGTHNVRVHRWAYEHFVGPIPLGLQIDHVRKRGCESRACTEPTHLEPITGRENTLRGSTTPAKNAIKTHCIRNHEFTTKNTYITSKGWRMCLACSRVRYHEKRGRHA